MIPKLNILSTLAALAFFFLPWIDIQCSNRSFATQSGYQIIVGEGTVAKELDGSRRKSSVSGKDESMGVSVLLGIALAAIAGAMIVAIMTFKESTGSQSNAAGILCASALALILIQTAIGFPVAGKIAEGSQKDRKHQRADDPLGVAGAEMAASMFQVRTLPGFYLELLALGIPTLILGNSLLDKLKKK